MSASEQDIQNTICDYLAYKNYFFWRNNTVGVYDPVNKTYRNPPKYSMNGVSDLILCEEGVTHFIEVKSETGRQTDSQSEFQEMCEDNDIPYYVVRSLQDLVEAGF